MPEAPTEEERVQTKSISRSLKREPVVMTLYRDEIERIAKQFETPSELSIDSEGHLIDILGNKSDLITGELAKELAEGGYSRLSQMEEVSRGRVSKVRDAGQIVLKEGIYLDENREKYNLVIAFRHIGQASDISFFRKHLGERHVPLTEALVIPGPQGPVSMIAQEKVTGKPLNEIEDLSELTATQQDELLDLLDKIQETYDKTGRFPDIHGRPLRKVRGSLRKADIRYTDSIVVGEKGAYLVDTDDIAHKHSEETFRGWLNCKLYAKKLRDLRRKVSGFSV